MLFSNFIKIILIVLCVSSCNESKIIDSKKEPQGIIISKDSVELIPEKGLVYYHGNPFTGSSVAHFSNGNLAVQIDYLHGKKHGFYRKWFDNNVKSYESVYEDGLQHGTTMSWWKNGNLRSRSNFKEGKGNGVEEQWYKSGKKFKLRNLLNGKEEGMQKSWRENGKLYNNYEAKNGRIFGLKKASLCFQLEDEEMILKE